MPINASETCLISAKTIRTRASSRSGQVMIEYILMIAMILGVILGVMSAVFKPYMEKIQKDIEARSSAVMAQDQLGIPLEWFLGNPKSFDDVDQKLAKAQRNVGSGGGRGGPSANNSNDPKGGGSGGKSGPSDTAGPGGRNSTLGNTADSKSSSGAGGGGTEGSEQGFKNKNKKSESSSGSSSSPSDDLKTEAQKKEEEKNDKNKEGGPQEVDSSDSFRVKKELVRQEQDRQSGGCREMNLFTLVKLAALIALVLLGGAVLVTTKGQKGSD